MKSIGGEDKDARIFQRSLGWSCISQRRRYDFSNRID